MNPIQQFVRWEAEKPEAIFLQQPLAGVWKKWTYRQAGQEIRSMATALAERGLPPRSRVGILSKNCAHWIMADLAIWMAGHISVPLYPTFTGNTIAQILEHSETKILFVGKLDTWEDQKAGIPTGVACIGFSTYLKTPFPAWEDLVTTHPPLKEFASWTADELATLKYTSGTTGNPKGVMLNFGAFQFVMKEGLNAIDVKPGDNNRLFSYLPLSHVAERSLVEMTALYSASTIYFSESLETFGANLAEAQPTIFLAVPRIWAKFREKILEAMPQPKLDKLLKIPLVNLLVKRAIKKKLGLAKCKWVISGAAPVAPELLRWFQKLDIIIRDTYGMTENLAFSHINLNKVKIGTVGHVWPGIQWRLSEQGELQMKHPGLMMGYYKDEALTNTVLTNDGYLKTGDKGEVDREGFFTITGRIKDQFKTDKGKFVDPTPIEMQLLQNPDIDQACVVGMGIPQPIALINLSAAGKSKSKDAIRDSIAQTLEHVNPSLESYEKLEAAVIMQRDWTVENGMLTPSMKLKRNELEKANLEKYPVWYKMKTAVVWE
ncbi:AMP-binding protein [Chryseolinea lacunae]|uniref:AMP-binding protein n=1 Tax=Chryseolinea lacunae TaxID=2801331 RepID=A0ABS1KQ59_9BACT|nr:AMP-binding protein [Chryseolinea lacunae]MBL0741618.1 AMP-binding protein [Chryseolinea lacunae]